MKNIKTSIILIIILLSLFLLSTSIIAAEIRPVLLDIKKAERSIKKVELEISKAESELRLFNDQAYDLLEKAKEYLDEAEHHYIEKNDDTVKEYTVKAINSSLKASLGTIESIPVQVRGLWLDSRTIANSGGREGLQELFNQAKDAGFNLILPEVFFKGQTIIPSNKLFIQDQRFKDWEEDPLTVIIEEATLRNMEVHAWVWVFNENTYGQPGIILEEHPEWANKDKEGNIVTYHNSSWLSPASEEVRNFLIERYLYLIRNYDLDGINLDYIRFPEEYRGSYGFDKYTVSLFKENYGVDPYAIELGSLEAGKWNLFREDLITDMVGNISTVLRNVDPEIIISADVIPGREEARYRALQDWNLWLNEDYLDFVLPMTYTENLFDELSDWLEGEKQNTEQYLYPGISVFKLSPAQVVEQVSKINKINPIGMALFAAAHLKQEHYTLLADGPFREKAILPYTDENQSLKMIRDHISKRIELLLNKNLITEIDRDKLIRNIDNKEYFAELLNIMKDENKENIVDILRSDLAYLEKVESLLKSNK